MNDDSSKNEPRWIIMYFDYNMESDGRLTGKEIMLKWCPDGVKVKSRMTFASSSKGLTDALNVRSLYLNLSKFNANICFVNAIFPISCHLGPKCLNGNNVLIRFVHVFEKYKTRVGDGQCISGYCDVLA